MANQNAMGAMLNAYPDSVGGTLGNTGTFSSTGTASGRATER